MRPVRKIVFKYCISIVIAFIIITSCTKNKPSLNTRPEDVAGNEEVLHYMETFDGRGVLSDSSLAPSAEEVLKSFQFQDDLALDLVLSEPAVTQPVFINFDYRGRLWVVQYNQYPYPKGLRVTGLDQHLRATFDKTPKPPPEGEKGADKITFFEDTDGDGVFDKATDAITGLNIATSVTQGRGKIWVMDPPYLLSYPDADQNGIPDDVPTVELEGFGIEDTHAVANNIRWGPDGWLYGAQGSTCTADVSSSASKHVRFNGQAIWRYHPDSHVFEVFAEGGGNTFDIEIDDKGRLYSGDNGNNRGYYYKQGAYYVRNMGKHGAFTNPYAFGYLPAMNHEGDNARFTHAFLRYQEQNLPERYRDKMIAINPLQSYIRLSSFDPHGSTFTNHDDIQILHTDDHWFRPVDLTTGPDGAVYLADWSDSRLTHVDPRDNWSKTTGRIYRLCSKEKTSPAHPVDMSKWSEDDLVDAFSDSSRWVRQQALQMWGDRKDKSAIPRLLEILQNQIGQPALEALWAIHLSDGFDDRVAAVALKHSDPFVRMWGVRLIGDANQVSPGVSKELASLASRELHPEVRSQLAATARRLPAEDALPVINGLLLSGEDADDPDIPLQIWWALESKTAGDPALVLAMFRNPDIWKRPTVQQFLLSRLMERWVMEGGESDYKACSTLLKMAPTDNQARILVTGLQEGLRGRDVTTLPATLVQALDRVKSQSAPLALALRRGDSAATTKALALIADRNADLSERLAYVNIFGEVNQPDAIPVMLKMVDDTGTPGALKQRALTALGKYNNPEIGVRVAHAYPDKIRADPFARAAALVLLASRVSWAEQLLDAIDREKQPGEDFIAHTIDRNDVPIEVSRQLLLLNDADITRRVQQLWPETEPVPAVELTRQFDRVRNVLDGNTGNPTDGRLIFRSMCGRCHRLFGEGAVVGPDLTGYDRRKDGDLLTHVVDPDAYIREGYEVYHVLMDDGRSLLGTIKARNGSALILETYSGEEITLSTENISISDAQKTSMMPERLLDRLSDQQVRDLFEYIANGVR